MSLREVDLRPSSIEVIVLAGGIGSRIREVYPDVPKPLILVAGEPFLFWLTSYFATQGLRSFIYSTGYKADQIDQWCADTSLAGLSRRVHEETARLGTGGGLLNCIDECGDWVVVTNGDSLCLKGLDKLVTLVGRDDWDGAMIGRRVADASRYGSLEVKSDGSLADFREKVQGQGLINCGIYLFSKRTLQSYHWPKAFSLEYDMLPRMLADGRRFVVIDVGEAPFLDIGTPDSVKEAGAFIATHADRFRYSVLVEPWPPGEEKTKSSAP